MTRHLFRVGEFDVTVLVMNEGEFHEFIEQVRAIVAASPPVEARTGTPMTVSDVERLRAAGHVPLIARGALTERLLFKYDVRTPYLTAIVRGRGPEVLRRLLAESGAI